MKIFLRCVFVFLFSYTPSLLFAADTDNIVNVFAWSQEIPRPIIAEFEKETGIKVNYASFDSNEMMYSKIRALSKPTYDLIEPSSYYIDRMRRQGLLEKLDLQKLTNRKNLDPLFLNPNYDPGSEHSLPFIWGITGIFLNVDYFPVAKTQNWKDLSSTLFSNQLMLLNDPREVFSIALRMLGYSINDQNPDHIKQAYYKLKSLMPNIKLFNSDAIISILIDEDATIGMAWNGDLYKAMHENSKLQFVYPQDGFEIWVDSFALLKNAPHRENAYLFLNFLMRPDIAAKISLTINYSSANLAARKLMPEKVQHDAALYPSVNVLKHGEFQTDMNDTTFALLEKYWEQLKMGA